MDVNKSWETIIGQKIGNLKKNQAKINTENKDSIFSYLGEDLSNMIFSKDERSD